MFDFLLLIEKEKKAVSVCGQISPKFCSLSFLSSILTLKDGQIPRFYQLYRSAFRWFCSLGACTLTKLFLVIKNSDSLLPTVLTCVKTAKPSFARVY